MIEVIPIKNREQWMALRSQDVTASDVAAICGVSQYKTAMRVWAEKAGVIDDQPDNNLLRRGRIMEPAVLAAIAEERPEWVVRRATSYYRDPEARVGATPDAFAGADGERADIVQCKVVSKPVFEHGWQDGPPLGYQLQALTEAMLTDAPRAHVAALVIETYSAELHIFTVERHAGAEQRIRDAVATFWADVAAGRQPTADYARDADLLQMLYPPKAKAEPVDLSTDNLLPELLEERAGLMDAKSRCEGRLEEIKAELVDKLKGAPVGICHGWRITHSVTHRNAYTVPAKDYPTLRVTRLKESKVA